MNHLQEISPDKLSDRGERALAKLARIARFDVNFGGAKALVIADRLAKMGSTLDAHTVVGEAYCSSTGTARDFTAYACPECGSPCFGEDAAFICCSAIYDDETDENEIED